MFNEILGSATLVGSLVALVHAVRGALTQRAETVRLDNDARSKDAAARAEAEADIRARLQACEVTHAARDRRDAARDERDRKRDIEHAREVGMVRGQLLALRDEIQVLRTASALDEKE